MSNTAKKPNNESIIKTLRRQLSEAKAVHREDVKVYTVSIENLEGTIRRNNELIEDAKRELLSTSIALKSEKVLTASLREELAETRSHLEKHHEELKCLKQKNEKHLTFEEATSEINEVLNRCQDDTHRTQAIKRSFNNYLSRLENDEREAEREIVNQNIIIKNKSILIAELNSFTREV